MIFNALVVEEIDLNHGIAEFFMSFFSVGLVRSHRGSLLG